MIKRGGYGDEICLGAVKGDQGNKDKTAEFRSQYNFKHIQVIGETLGIKGHPDVIITL